MSRSLRFQDWRRIEQGVLFRSLGILSKRDRRLIFAVILIQIFLGILDLVGVALIGILGTLAVSGVQSQAPGSRISEVLDILNLESSTLQMQVALLGVSAASFLIARTIFSVFFTRKILFFLSRRGAVLSAELISKLLSRSLLDIQSRTVQQTLYSVTTGVNTITLGVLATAVNLISDTSLLLIMTLGLILVDIKVALGTFIIFGGVGLLMYKLLHERARNLGLSESRISVEGNERIVEVISSYREALIRNRRSYYAEEIGALRLGLSNTTAGLAFLPNISKYIIEVTVIFGALVLAASQFALNDARHAVATLSVFIAASTRIAPAALRLQQGAIQIRGSLGSATPTLDLINELKDVEPLATNSNEQNFHHAGFESSVIFKDIEFSYPNSERLALRKVNLEIRPSSFTAIVGPSGAGKTTLVDVLLGVITPNYGEVHISGMTPAKTIEKWPGALAYVPQDVSVFSGSILENIGMGFPINLINRERVSNAIKIAQLGDFIENLPQGLLTQTGEKGSKLSGGQRQRLGIARALYTNPRLIVLDEATSALDGKTEADIADAIEQLKGEVTLIVIAHRLSTIRNADQIVYMENGEIKHIGKFDDLRIAEPNFDEQAKLMGL